uniref:C-type lectin domain family 4 member F-like isoform X2 n=1 Tax=Ciona intestinalis TaxID=7719 RepID=UPI0002B8E499|nr:C-type lectin domain family 4 member F-like isoform X2 [Ciona intestinalis]|eukprot:XP_002121230.2 C-type lectin domain family 4 member F-like isoform X2 [Ciona intestinalis]
MQCIEMEPVYQRQTEDNGSSKEPKKPFFKILCVILVLLICGIAILLSIIALIKVNSMDRKYSMGFIGQAQKTASNYSSPDETTMSGGESVENKFQNITLLFNSQTNELNAFKQNTSSIFVDLFAKITNLTKVLDTSINNILPNVQTMKEELRNLSSLAQYKRKSIEDDTAKLKNKTELLERDVSFIVNSIGWYSSANGYKYHVKTTKSNWDDSRRYCKSLGGDLSAGGMRNVTSRTFIIRTILVPLDIQQIWIGLNDNDADGVWNFVDGVASNQNNTDYAPNEPSGCCGTNVHCASLYKSFNYKVDDAACGAHFSALCEKRWQ